MTPTLQGDIGVALIILAIGTVVGIWFGLFLLWVRWMDRD
jgi:uncharacterized membrane protein YccC